MTFADLEKWHRLSDLDKYSRRVILALKPEWMLVKRKLIMNSYEVSLKKDDFVCTVPLGLHVANNCVKEPSGVIYDTNDNLIFFGMNGEIMEWENSKVKPLKHARVHDWILNRMEFVSYTESPTTKEACDSRILECAPVWWREFITRYVDPFQLEIRYFAENKFTRWQSNSEKLDETKCYRLKE